MVVLRLRDGSEWEVDSRDECAVRDELEARNWIVAVGPSDRLPMHASLVRTTEVVALWKA